MKKYMLLRRTHFNSRFKLYEEMKTSGWTFVYEFDSKEDAESALARTKTFSKADFIDKTEYVICHVDDTIIIK